MINVVILAGGEGTRLWPLSRSDRPKQFLRLPEGKSLIEQSVERAQTLTTNERIWIVTVASQVEETKRTLPEFSPDQIFAEPVGCNSGPAALAITLFLQAKENRPTTLLMFTADHWIPKSSGFSRAMEKGVERASDGESLVTFGLPPQSPRTDFGYIEAKPQKSRNGIQRVRRFVEKPPLARAKGFLRSKRYFWNSGMFAWRSDFFLQQMALHAPKLFNPLSSIAWKASSLSSELSRIYAGLPNISLDYALMEKSKSVEVVASRFQWSDLGTWKAVYEILGKRKGENVVLGKGEVVEGRGNFIYSQANRTVILGADDLVVIDTPDVTMVTTRERSVHLKRYREKLLRSS